MEFVVYRVEQRARSKSQTTTSERVPAKEDMRQRLYGNCTETGLSVVVAYLGGSTTTNHEGLMMRVTCDTKRVNTHKTTLTTDF